MNERKHGGLLAKILFLHKLQIIKEKYKDTKSVKFSIAFCFVFLGALGDILIYEPMSAFANEVRVSMGWREYEKSANELSTEMKTQTEEINSKIETVTKKMMDLAANDADVYSHLKADFESIIGELNSIKPQVAKLDSIQSELRFIADKRQKVELETQGFSKVSDFELYRGGSTMICQKDVLLKISEGLNLNAFNVFWGDKKIAGNHDQPNVALKTDKYLIKVNRLNRTYDDENKPKREFTVICEPLSEEEITKVKQNEKA